MKVRPGFRMDGDPVGPRFRESVEKRIDRRNHQVDVERLGAVGPQRLHHRGPNGEVGDEVAVHDVDVDPVGAGLVDRAHFLAELREVGGQNGRGDQGAGHRPD